METRAELKRDGAQANDSMVDVVIVSAYGRGNWMASELAGRGWDITLVDVSESLGPWEPEDCEGPFGLLESSDLLPGQKNQLLAEGEALQVPNGFTLWLKDGPLELKSELTKFLLQKKGISEEAELYLRNPVLTDRDLDRERSKLMRLPFERSWFAHFAHQITSNVFVENHVALDRRKPAPLFSPLTIRQVTQAGWQKGLKACQANGAKVRPRAAIKDLRLANGLVDAIEIEEERSGIQKGRSFVWMLSSGETERFSERVHKQLYPAGTLESVWFWARFQMEIQAENLNDQLPPHFVVLGDPFLPWTHENLLVVRKRREEKNYDVWLRIPTWARFEESYHSKMQTAIEEILKKRIPQAQLKNVQPPAEARHSYKKLGAPRFPVYEPEARARFLTHKSSNLFFCGPEQWDFLDWLGQYRRQNEILTRLEKLKAQWVAEANRAARDSQRNLSP